MSRITRTRLSAGLTLAVAATFALSACSMGGSTAEPSDEPSTPAMEETEEPMTADPAANLVGPGCADYAEAVPDGAGSVEGMAADPVAVAAQYAVRDPGTEVSATEIAGQSRGPRGRWAMLLRRPHDPVPDHAGEEPTGTDPHPVGGDLDGLPAAGGGTAELDGESKDTSADPA